MNFAAKLLLLQVLAVLAKKFPKDSNMFFNLEVCEITAVAG
jgi:hypothetical protein